MTCVLVLRPEPGASATVRKAGELGLAAISVPLFEIEAIAWKAPAGERFDGLLLTSANAVRMAEGRLGELRELPVFAVGEATAEAARRAGLAIAASGDSGVDRLLDSIEPRLRLLHLCGEHRIEVKTTREIISVVVYRSTTIDVVDLSPMHDVVALLHSPRAAARFAELIVDRSSIAIAAISGAAAQAAGAGWRHVAVADRPTDDALLALAAGLCNKPDPE